MTNLNLKVTPEQADEIMERWIGHACTYDVADLLADHATLREALEKAEQLVDDQGNNLMQQIAAVQKKLDLAEAALSAAESARDEAKKQLATMQKLYGRSTVREESAIVERDAAIQRAESMREALEWISGDSIYRELPVTGNYAEDGRYVYPERMNRIRAIASAALSPPSPTPEAKPATAECVVNEYSSAVCNRGTKCCNANHSQPATESLSQSKRIAKEGEGKLKADTFWNTGKGPAAPTCWWFSGNIVYLIFASGDLSKSVRYKNLGYFIAEVEAGHIVPNQWPIPESAQREIDRIKSMPPIDIIAHDAGGATVGKYRAGKDGAQ